MEQVLPQRRILNSSDGGSGKKGKTKPINSAALHHTSDGAAVIMQTLDFRGS
jgi:hypothetical protein